MTGYADHIFINTTEAKITNGSEVIVYGTIEGKTFSGPNNGEWNYSVATFKLNSSQAQSIFSAENKVSICGTHALSVQVTGSFTVGTDLDVSGKEIDSFGNERQLFWLGGFVRLNKSCCTQGKLITGSSIKILMIIIIIIITAIIIITVIARGIFLLADLTIVCT